MKAAGAQLALITWYADHGKPLADTQIQALRKVAECVHALPIRAVFSDRIKRLIRLMRWPSHVSSRFFPVQSWMRFGRILISSSRRRSGWMRFIPRCSHKGLLALEELVTLLSQPQY